MGLLAHLEEHSAVNRKVVRSKLTWTVFLSLLMSKKWFKENTQMEKSMETEVNKIFHNIKSLADMRYYFNEVQPYPIFFSLRQDIRASNINNYTQEVLNKFNTLIKTNSNYEKYADYFDRNEAKSSIIRKCEYDNIDEDVCRDELIDKKIDIKTALGNLDFKECMIKRSFQSEQEKYIKLANLAEERNKINVVT